MKVPQQRVGTTFTHRKRTGCWVWQEKGRSNGYGTISVSGRAYGAHVLSYLIHYGEIPKGLMVCHHCDNPPCVNPEHLFAGTNQDNTDDMTAKGRGRWPGWPMVSARRFRAGVGMARDNARQAH